MTTPENKIKTQIRALLEEHGIQPASKAGVHASAAGWYFMPVPWGVKGIPDFIGHYRGKFFAIEAKAPGKYPTGLQALQIKQLSMSGAAMFVVNDAPSLREVQDWLLFG